MTVCVTIGCDRSVEGTSYYLGKTGPLCRKCFEELEGLRQHAVRPRRRGLWERIIGFFS